MIRPVWPRLLALVAACVHVSSLVAQQPAPLVLSQLTWFARDGMRLGTVGPLADHGNLELSPDGTRVAVAVLDRDVGTRDIWFYDVGSGTRSRFTSEPADENWLVWSADGSRAIFNSFAPTGFQLFESSTSNLADRRPLVSGGAGKWPVSWSRDGRYLLYVTNDRPSTNDIWTLPLPVDGGNPPFRYHVTDAGASENWAAFSPDGRWVAFSSSESGQAAVYVAPFPLNGRSWRVSAGGGSQARWRRDGRDFPGTTSLRTRSGCSGAATRM